MFHLLACSGHTGIANRGILAAIQDVFARRLPLLHCAVGKPARFA
jgi:hypothetical protein